MSRQCTGSDIYLTLIRNESYEVLPNVGDMTRGSILEYTEVVRGHYPKASKKEKGRILDEFVQVIGYHRKAAIRLLPTDGSQRQGKQRGCRRRYGPEV